MIGDTATDVGPAGGHRVADPGDGQHRPDRHDRVGRADDDQVGPGDGVEHPGRRAGRLDAGEADRRTATSWWRPTKYSWKPISVAVRVAPIDPGLDPVVGHRAGAVSPTPHRAAISAVTSLKVAPSASRLVRYRWVPRSRSPRLNQPSRPPP